MKYSELQPTLQNLTKEKITTTSLANILGVSSQTMTFRIKEVKKDIPPEEISLIEAHYNVELAETNIPLDFYPDVFGSCGSGTFVVSEQKEVIQVPQKLISGFSKTKTYSVITAVGESMLPYIQSKDKLIVEHWNGEQIKDNQVYVFCYKNEIFIKRLIKNVDELVIKSDNPDPMYRPRFIEKNDMNNIVLIGEIVGLLRDLRL